MTVDNAKKQNILIVHNYYQIPGGEDTVVANEKKMLEKHEHKVILYSRNNAELKQMSKRQKIFLPITTVFNPRTYREIKKLIKQRKSPYKLIRDVSLTNLAYFSASILLSV